MLHVALAGPDRLDEAERLLGEHLGAPVQRSAEGAQLAVVTDSARSANAALAALIAGGFEITDFSMGSPSLDEVFFALTGRPAETAAAEEDAA
jgi:ABC-2 type transport system ATP-binding protein